MNEDFGGLEAADGPRVRLALPDGQELLAVVRRRRREADPGDGGWWYLLEVSLWGAARLADGRVVAEPAPAECWAPAHVCTPLDGEDYSDVPTDRASAAAGPAWLLEDVPGRDGDLVVHRGDCGADHATVRSATADMVRQAVMNGIATRCPICSPPLP